MGHRQAVQNQHIHRFQWRLIRVFTVCLHNVLSNSGKAKHTTKIGNMLVLLIGPTPDRRQSEMLTQSKIADQKTLEAVCLIAI